MIKRTTWVFLGIFALLILALVYWQRSGQSEVSEPTPTAALPLLSLDVNALREVRIENDAGSIWRYQRNEQGAWASLDPLAPVEATVGITPTINALTELRVLNTLTEEPPDEVMGLKQPAFTITLTTANGRQEVIQIGAVTPTGRGYYVRVNDSAVSVVSKYQVDDILTLAIATPTPEQPLQTETAPPASSP